MDNKINSPLQHTMNRKASSTRKRSAYTKAASVSGKKKKRFAGYDSLRGRGARVYRMRAYEGRSNSGIVSIEHYRTSTKGVRAEKVVSVIQEGGVPKRVTDITYEGGQVRGKYSRGNVVNLLTGKVEHRW
jgi:hypothetical protein